MLLRVCVPLNFVGVIPLWILEWRERHIFVGISYSLLFCLDIFRTFGIFTLYIPIGKVGIYSNHSVCPSFHLYDHSVHLSISIFFITVFSATFLYFDRSFIWVFWCQFPFWQLHLYIDHVVSLMKNLGYPSQFFWFLFSIVCLIWYICIYYFSIISVQNSCLRSWIQEILKILSKTCSFAKCCY